MSKKNKQEQVEQPQVDAVADGVQAPEQVVEQAVEQVAEQVPEQEQAPEAGDVDTSAGEQSEQVQEVAVVDEPTPTPTPTPEPGPEQSREMTFAEVMAWNAANHDKTPPVHVVQKKQQRKMMRF